jgi:hypothetical protein
MGTLTIPSSVTEVTTGWLSDVLGVPVRSFAPEVIGEGVGLMGELVRLRLECDGDGPASVILKLPASHPENRAVAHHYRFYDREAAFYRELAADVGVRVPACYYPAADPEADRYALLLQDLCHLRCGDQVAGASLADAEAVVDMLATLHATWWDHPRLEELEWLIDVNDPINKAAQANYLQVWPLFLEKFGHLLDADEVAMGEAVGQRYGELFDLSYGRPMTLIHGDARLDNMFFDEAGVPTVIDWQIATRGKGGYFDVVYFLGGSLDPELRRREGDRLMADYDAALAARGAAPLPDDERLEALQASALVCLLYPVIGGTTDLANERGMRLGERLTQGYFSLAMELDAMSVLE